jgi:hypothetical protein
MRLLAMLTILPVPQPWKKLGRGRPLLVLMRTFLTAPTARAIYRRQEEIDSRGRSLSLGRALMAPTS